LPWFDARVILSGKVGDRIVMDNQPRNWNRWGADDQRGTLDDLARDQVHEFMLVVAPLRIDRGLGSPINPIALT
jgi:hypothetical protein